MHIKSRFLKNSYSILAGLFIFLFVAACSTKKNTFISRNYHTLTTKYNVLYNGNEAYKVAYENLLFSYEDNFYETLPIEAIDIKKIGPTQRAVDTNFTGPFSTAERKAVKAIQKHSMLIAGREKNRQIDEAYHLLGKSRYFSGRFVPALEAFNFIIINYPDASLINETQIWKSKSNIHIRNEDEAITILDLVLKSPSLTPENIEDANTALAMAYENADSIDVVIKHLNEATLTKHNIEQTTRNLYVLGQLYRQKDEIDSSSIAFQKIIDLRKAPYQFIMHSEIELTKNISTVEDTIIAKEKLLKFIDDGYNKVYYGDLNFQMGELNKDNYFDEALTYYQEAVKAEYASDYLKEKIYTTLGHHYFDKAKFVSASKYYDSVLHLAKDTLARKTRRIKKRRESLEEVIQFETIAIRDDSILKVVAMTETEREDFFNKHIENLKVEEKRELEEINNTQYSGSAFYDSGSKNITKGKWYFYNTQASGFGQQEFSKIWGNRTLEDNWRISNKTAINTSTESVEDSVSTASESQSGKYELSHYLRQIPESEVEIDSISQERNDAYFNLGNIYYSKFKENELAAAKLEKLLKFNPEDEIILQTKYILYKIYGELENEKAIVLRNDIVENYPESKFASIILNPQADLSDENSDLAELEYEEVYYIYKSEDYECVIDRCNEAIDYYDGKTIMPKYSLLKAYAIRKEDGEEAFKEALKIVYERYPETEQGIKADDLLLKITDTIEINKEKSKL